MQAANVLQLTGRDGDGDAAGEADGHGVRDMLDERSQPEDAHQGQHQAGHEYGQQQTLDAKPGDRGGHQHNEGAGRTADLESAAAQQRDHEAPDDGGVEPPLRRYAGGHGDGHRQRQGDDGYRQGGDRVLAKMGEPIALPKRGRELGVQEVGGGRAVGHVSERG